MGMKSQSFHRINGEACRQSSPPRTQHEPKPEAGVTGARTFRQRSPPAGGAPCRRLRPPCSAPVHRSRRGLRKLQPLLCPVGGKNGDLLMYIVFKLPHAVC